MQHPTLHIGTNALSSTFHSETIRQCAVCRVAVKQCRRGFLAPYQSILSLVMKRDVVRIGVFPAR